MNHRWVLALAVTVFAMLTGRALGGRRMRAAEEIRLLMDEMQTLRVLTLERLMPLGAALLETGAPVLRRAGELMRGDGALSPEEAWHRAAETERQPGGSLEELESAEIDFTGSLFAAVGALSRREQEERYAQVIAGLGRMEAEKRVAGRERRKLCTSLGALTGLAVSVMLI